MMAGARHAMLDAGQKRRNEGGVSVLALTMYKETGHTATKNKSWPPTRVIIDSCNLDFRSINVMCLVAFLAANFGCCPPFAHTSTHTFYLAQDYTLLTRICCNTTNIPS